MALLPKPYGLAVMPRADRPIASVDPRAAGAAAGAMAGLGADIVKVGERWQDIDDTAAAKERDAYVSDEIRRLLYDPTTGFTNTNGKDAVAQRGSVSERIQAIRDAANKDLSPGARRKLEARLQERLDRAEMTVDTHTGGQRQAWLETAGNARIIAAENDAWTSGEDFSASFNVIAEELQQKARREGWDTAVLDLKLAEAKSGLMVNKTMQIAATDPERALDFLEKNGHAVLGRDMVALKAKLEPIADDAAGRKLARRVYSGNTKYDTKIELAMGPARPYSPGPEIIDVIGSAAEDVFGPGARVVITSGQEGDKEQHGSNRHKTGSAADIAIYRPDGTRVLATDKDMAEFAKAAAARGALGIGFGAEYMGGEHIHVDMVAPGAGQGHTWATGATAISSDLTAAMNAPRASQGNIRDILAEPNERRRNAALQEYSLLSKVSDNEKKAAMDAATHEAFKYISDGFRVDTIPIDVQHMLGMDAMSALRTYEAKSAPEKAETHPTAYLELRRMQANDPAGFAATNLLTYADRLSLTDLKGFLDDQTKPPSEGSRAAASRLMSVARSQMERAGISFETDPGSTEAKQRDAMVGHLLRWQESFVAANNGRGPNDAEIYEEVGRELLPVVLDPWGVKVFGGGKKSGFAFAVPDVAASKLPNTGITIGGEKIDDAMIQNAIAGMQAEGQVVTSQALVDRIIEGRARGVIEAKQYADIAVAGEIVPQPVIREVIAEMHAAGQNVTREAIEQRLNAAVGQ